MAGGVPSGSARSTLCQIGGVPAEKDVAFRAVPVFLGGSVPAAARLPVGIGEAGDFLRGRGRSGNGWPLMGIAMHAAHLGSCAGMGHGIRTPIVITEVASAKSGAR
jgi:hypothetical protein